MTYILSYDQIVELINTPEKVVNVSTFYNKLVCKIFCLSEEHKTAEVTLRFDGQNVIFDRTINGVTTSENVTKEIAMQLQLSLSILEVAKPEKIRRRRK